ncbi:carboxypeptidase-like regulatory domain-containing protein [Melioribacteraceae bacterium 4301-Me]|uniref:carboxypeptidase-like regulatory domain-containing protein n=1 Tax=Pyranulibacter aquaticus TaxID=3163344 RepID=UPI00359661CF
MKKTIYIGALLVLSFFYSCNAPRTNPLDPQNPNYSLGQLDGYVFTPSRIPLNKVRVTWKNENITVETDSTGYFKIQGIQRKNGTLYYEKLGYANDSVLVEWGDQKSKRIEDKILIYVTGQLDGFVFNPERSPLQGVKVLWNNQNILVQTDINGHYLFSNLAKNNGLLYFEKDGFAKDSVNVVWDNQENYHVADKILNYTIGQIDGYVYDPDKIPIKNVKIIWGNQNLLATSDQNGHYLLTNVSMKNGKLYFEKDGFASDSVNVIWGTQKNYHVPDKTLIYTIGTIDGYVKTVALPRLPIPNAKVSWKNQNIVVTTNSNGYYKIDNVPKQNGTIYFEKEGYSPDSSLVQWGSQKSYRVEDIFLNSIPTLDYYNIYTSVENKFPDIQSFKIFFECTISDKENDVDSVFVSSNSINFKKQLIFNPTTKNYENNFTTSDLNLTSFENVIGKNFDIIVKERSGKTFNIGSSYVKRIIKQEIIIDSPSNKQVVSSTPQLNWQRFLPGFNFKYRIEIYTDEIQPVLVWSKDNISQDAINYIVDQSLQTGDYFWVIWCVDEFKNKSRSKPASFVVQ